MSEGEERRWKVGELAGATGLTVRALHHYDDVGLLVPSERSSANHRLYSEDDVRRLYRVIALRRLGLGLDEKWTATRSGGRWSGNSSADRWLRHQVARSTGRRSATHRLSRFELATCRGEPAG